MEDLAAGMGVNKAALYRYFGNRAGLHRALIGRWVSRALAEFRAARSLSRLVRPALEASIHDRSAPP